MSVVYIAGPMSGLPEHNFPAFHAAAEELAAAGFPVVLDPARYAPEPSFTWADYMRRALPDVLRAELVAVLPGWYRSRGACLEIFLARTLGVPCRHIDEVLDDPASRENLIDTQPADELWFVTRKTPSGVAR